MRAMSSAQLVPLSAPLHQARRVGDHLFAGRLASALARRLAAAPAWPSQASRGAAVATSGLGRGVSPALGCGAFALRARDGWGAPGAERRWVATIRAFRASRTSPAFRGCRLRSLGISRVPVTGSAPRRRREGRRRARSRGSATGMKRSICSEPTQIGQEGHQLQRVRKLRVAQLDALFDLGCAGPRVFCMARSMIHRLGR